MINISNDFTQEERILLKKLYEYYSEYGAIANIDEWAEELKIPKESLNKIASNMYQKGWLKYYESLSAWGGIQAGISLEGMKKIGKKPIDFNNEIKKVDLFLDNENPHILITYYNHKETKYFLAQDEISKLTNFSNKEGYSGYVEIYEWIKSNRKDILDVISKYRNSFIFINTLIDKLKK